jgi:hypothetical protein
MGGDQDWQWARRDFVKGRPPDGDDADTELARRRGEFGPLAKQFAELAAQLFSAGTAADVLERVVVVAAVLLPAADFVSISLRKGDREFLTPVTTDELAMRLDEIQYETQEGPCVDATRTGGTGLSIDGDLGVSQTWPKWGPAAAELGIRSVVAIGLMPTTPAPRLGALNLYARAAHALGDIDHDLCLLLAAHAGAAVIAVRSIETADMRADNLQRALLSRDVIGQAKGMLMAQRNISAEEAFEVLRVASQSLNVKLTAIAEAIVERRVEL